MTHRVLTAFWKGGDVPGYEPDTFTWNHVNKLAEGVERAFTDAVLVVMRDKWMADKPDERHHLIREVDLPGTHIGGWTPWLELFRPDDMAAGETCVYVGLDTVFCRDCDWLFSWRGFVGLIPDPDSADDVASCVVVTDGFGARLIHSRYRFHRRTGFGGLHTRERPSDWMMFRELQQQFGWARLDDPPRRILSYKKHHLVKNDGFLRDEVSIVYCHGHPRPWEIPRGNPVRELWENGTL